MNQKITYHPRECDIACDDDYCPYHHYESWSIISNTGKILHYLSEKDAELALIGVN